MAFKKIKTNKELFIELFNKQIKEHLSDHFSKKAIANGNGGWKLDARYYLDDIIYQLIGLHPTDYALFNTPKASNYKLRIDYINGDFFLVPYDAQAVYFDPEFDDIIIDEALKRPAKKKSLEFKLHLSKDNKVFLGYL